MEMDFENIKATWERAGTGKKSRDQLSDMISGTKKIRRRLMIEAAMILVFMAVYYDGFDGADKPLWANALLLAAAIAYVLTRYAGWRTLGNPVKEKDLKKSLSRFQRSLKQILVSSLTTSFLFGSAIILFFTSSVDLTRKKYFILAGMLLWLVAVLYLSHRKWRERIKGITVTLMEFDEIPEAE